VSSFELGTQEAELGATTGSTAPVASGSFVVSFTDITPPIRYDGNPWVSVQIQQSSALDQPFSQIDSQPLAPADTDPTNPVARNITTAMATSQEGIFALTFFDAAGASSQTLIQVMNQPSEIRPTVAELGAFMRARTVIAGSGGNEAGTFTTQTRPTAAEADQIINQAVDQVLMQIGADIPDRFITQARFATLLYAAQLVEIGFYRNEVNKDQSAFAQYETLFNNTVTGLTSAIADEDPASPSPGFLSVPLATAGQVRFQALVKATDPTTGKFDPTKLPVDLFFPRGPGGIPTELLELYPWLGFDPAWGFGDSMITQLEYPD
jgi:hypothetical protein